MSDEFGQLLSEQKEVAISQGAVVSGQVIAVKEDEIVLNIGYKADAVISRNEFTNIPNANLCDLVKVGDEIEVYVKSYDPETGLLVGEIVNVSVDESAMTDGKVDVAKVAPITFDPFNNAYHVLGEKVGNAFSDGMALR